MITFRSTVLEISNPSNVPSVVAGRGIFTGALVTGICGFIITILFLFCTPDFEILFSLSAPQPFVQIYALALGRGPATFMTLLAALEYGLVRTTLNSLISFALSDT